MIYKIAKRSARSALGDNFADVWYTFVKSFNRLKTPSTFVNPFLNNPETIRSGRKEQFSGHVESLQAQLEILQGIVSKKANSEQGEIKKTLLSLNADLSKVKDNLETVRLLAPTNSIILEEKESEIKKNIIHARANIYLLSSLKKEKK